MVILFFAKYEKKQTLLLSNAATPGLACSEKWQKLSVSFILVNSAKHFYQMGFMPTKNMYEYIVHLWMACQLIQIVIQNF